MKKRFLVIIISLFMFLCLSGCNSENEKPETITITDMIGRTVEVPTQINRVVCIGAGSLRLYSYIGDMEKLVAVEQCEGNDNLISIRPYQMVHNTLFKSLIAEGNVCGTGGPTGSAEAEKIITCNPDIIFSIYVSDAVAMDTLQTQTGTPVVTVSYGNVEAFDQNVLTSITLMGKILNREERALEVTTYIKNLTDDLHSRTRDIKEEDKDSVYLACQSNYGLHGFQSSTANYSLFKATNVKNVLDENGYTGYSKEIDLEAIMIMDPDIIIIDAGGLNILKQEYALSDKAKIFNSLKAFKNGEVYLIMPYNAYYTNLEIAYCDAYYIGKSIYPDAFSDIDIDQKANEITEKLLGISFYTEIANSMFGGFQKLNLVNTFANYSN